MPPVPFRFTGLFTVCMKAGIDGDFPDGLHMGLFAVFTKAVSRYEKALPAGWASQKPFTGTHKDHFPFSARRRSLHGLCMGFAKTSPGGDSACGL